MYFARPDINLKNELSKLQTYLHGHESFFRPTTTNHD